MTSMRGTTRSGALKLDPAVVMLLGAVVKPQSILGFFACKSGLLNFLTYSRSASAGVTQKPERTSSGSPLDPRKIEVSSILRLTEHLVRMTPGHRTIYRAGQTRHPLTASSWSPVSAGKCPLAVPPAVYLAFRGVAVGGRSLLASVGIPGKAPVMERTRL